MKNLKQNSNLFDSNKKKIKISSRKHLNTIEECPETEDIIKKIENLDFSTDKSFETPFITLSKTRDKIINKINNLNKSISVPDLFFENYEEFAPDIKSLKDEEINDSNYLEILSKFLNINKEKAEEKKSNGNNISKLVLNEKINRIYVLFQKCNLNKNCLDNMNKLLNLINNKGSYLQQPVDLILDVFSELLSKIQEEYSIKNDLINKLNNMTLKKENFEKQILSIKNELESKEKQLEKLMDEETLENVQSNKENNDQQALLSFINNMKKENQLLFEKVLGYKINMKKILSSSRILYEKYKSCLTENEKLKLKKSKDFSIESVNKMEIKGKTTIKKLKSSSSFNNIRINTEYNNINMTHSIIPLTNNLIKLSMDINRMLFKCDFNLVKISKNNKIPLNDINELNQIIDISFLSQEKNFQLFSKYIYCNFDIINNKILNLPNILSSNNNRLNKESKNSSMTKKNTNELIKNSSIGRINQSIKFFSPENKTASKTMKNYINLRKTRNNIRNQKLIRNSTSRDGLSFMNFYNNNDSNSLTVFQKNSNNNVNNKMFNQTVNLEKQRNKNKTVSNNN